MKTDLQILIDARTLLITKNWCQGSLARDSKGNSVFTSDTQADAFDIIGAIGCVSENGYGDLPISITEYIRLRGYQSVIQFNDDPKRTKLNVIEMFDDLIKALKNDYYTSCYDIVPVGHVINYNEL